MAQRELTNGEAMLHRQMTPFSEYKRRFNITDDLSSEERMKKLGGLFDILANCAQHYSDNLQPGAIERRITKDDGVPSSPEEMQTFLRQDAHTVKLMHDCIEEMRSNPLSRMNGTACEFARRSQILAEETIRLKTGKKALAGLLHPEKQSGSGQSLQVA